MQYIFSPDGRQAIADGIITLEQYLQISSNECYSLQYLFSSDGRQAIANGTITLEQYLQIPLHERNINIWDGRHRVESLLTPDEKQAMAEGIITREQYFKIPLHECYSMKYLFSPDGRQAMAERIITLEQYLRIPPHERFSMECLFSPDGRQAIAEGIITLEQYLQIPTYNRETMNETMKDLFLLCWQIVAKAIITLKRYPQPSTYNRGTMKYLFSSDGRQAVIEGIITLEQYLQIPWHDRFSMKYLFSPDGRQAMAEGIITLEQYLQIPRYERQNAMIALRDQDTRQRIINGQITVENILGIHPHLDDNNDVVAIPHINGTQSTHTASVHQSVSESAIRLANRYKSKIDGVGLERTIRKTQAYINSLTDDSEKNKVAQRGFLRIVAPNHTFTDPISKVSTRQLLALAFLALHDDEKRVGSLEDAQMQFVEALYEVQRGYNLSELGIDQGGPDRYVCSAGTFNKFIEKLHGIHPDCQLLYMTNATASLKLPIVVREEAVRYLTTFANANTADALARLIEQIKEDGVGVIWDHIKNNVAKLMFDEFSSLYKNRADSHFSNLVEAGKEVELGDLTTFQEQVQNGNCLSNHSSTLEMQKEDIINQEETFLVKDDKDVELNDLSTFQKIAIQLDKLENKAKNLYDRGAILAYCKATNIVRLLRDLNHRCFTEKKIDSKTYKEKAFDIISQERLVLDKHRGYKQILGNLLILITTLGMGQLINKGCTGNFLFFKTDSAKHIDTLSNIIDKIELTSPNQAL
ncbi:hypothetical protein RICGR_1333 [Rickettsiella grylli]|uniref:Uncharacterized protein n=2 Tax=Rickettsiella grylli TaxID=59196 RepID=A8PPL8_9COXI|nr:hypothetical protein RICGR_1333 [Rickettsiella grylli]